MDSNLWLQQPKKHVYLDTQQGAHKQLQGFPGAIPFCSLLYKTENPQILIGILSHGSAYDIDGQRITAVIIVLLFVFIRAARTFRRDRMECRQVELDRVHDRTMRYMKALHLTSKETAKNSAPIDPTKMFSSALGHQTCQDEHMSDLLLEGLQKLLHTPNK